MNKVYRQIKDKINRANSIALFCHIRPDFDALSSMYALYHAIKTGKKVDMYSNRALNDKENLLLDASLVKTGKIIPEDYDLLISVDTPNVERLGIYGEAVKHHPNTIKIDHHLSCGEEIGKIQYVDVASSSCCELVFKVLKAMKAIISPEIATILYIGLLTDTNSFTNTNTNPESFLAAYELSMLKADIAKVNDVINRQKSQSEVNITKTFYETFKRVDKEIGICTVTQADLKKAKAEKIDCDGFSMKLASIKGINVSCCIIELDNNTYNCSMRSRLGYAVNGIAANLGGGGHIGAAGCVIKAKSMSDAEKIVLKEIRKYLKSRLVHEK